MAVFRASSWRMSHFPRNPVSGGRPPRERMVIRVRPVSHGVMLIALVKSARFGVFRMLRVRKRVAVIVK